MEMRRSDRERDRENERERTGEVDEGGGRNSGGRGFWSYGVFVKVCRRSPLSLFWSILVLPRNSTPDLVFHCCLQSWTERSTVGKRKKKETENVTVRTPSP